MELRYSLTCNPWSDRGAVLVADRLEGDASIVEQVAVTQGEIVVRFYEGATREQVETALATLIQERQNGLFVPNSLARALTAMGRDVARTDARGLRTTDLTA